MGYQYIFIITDITTYFTILRPLKDKPVKEVSHEFVKIICELSFPKLVQSDNGTEFVNKIMSTVHDQAGFNHQFISSHYPQANGATKSHIKLTKSMLLKSHKGDLKHWSTLPFIAQFALIQCISHHSDSKPFKFFFSKPLSYPENYFESISKLKTPYEITSLTSCYKSESLSIVLHKAKEKQG